MPKNRDEIADIINKMNRDAGRVKCKKCSDKNWEVFHEPGKCPKQKPADKKTK